MKNPANKILIVDDESDILEFLRYNLEVAGYTVCEAIDGVSGLEMAIKENPDLLFFK